jgi:uncharacterized membrane protein
MESRAKIVGHPVHPILVAFPLGLLGTAAIFDGLQKSTGNESWSEAAHHMMAAGLIGGAAAAIPGLIDYLEIPEKTRAQRIGLLHGIGNAGVLGLFGASWAMRRENPGRPSGGAVALSFAGMALSVLTGWLGGELVDRLGVGVDDGANLNAPSSLTRRPAHEWEGDGFAGERLTA